MAIYRMNGPKVICSIGILTDGTAIHIDKSNGQITRHKPHSPEAKENKELVKQEWNKRGHKIPPAFLLAMAI